MAVENKKLKWGNFKSPQSDNTSERYIIENQEDLDAFAKEFPEIRDFSVYQSMQNCIENDTVVLATDRHPISKFPTWCTESKDFSHPSSIQRV